jgi:tetratricopeptide (TPR) repeat protein
MQESVPQHADAAAPRQADGQRLAETDATHAANGQIVQRSAGSRGLVQRSVFGGAVVLIGVLLFFGGWWYVQDQPLRQMRAAVDNQKWAEGLRLALKYVSVHPQDGEAWRVAGRCYGSMGQFTAAEQCFAKASNLTVDELRLRADGLIRMDRTTEAAEVLRELLAKLGKDPDVTQRLAIMEFRRGQHEEAFALTRELRENPDRAPAACYVEATFHTALMHNEAAVSCLEKALQLNPEADRCGLAPETALWYMGTALQDVGRTEEARDYLKRSLAIGQSAEAYLSLGEAEEASGDAASAENAWRRALELDPKHAEAMFALAKLALKRNHPEEAIEWLELAQRRGKNGTAVETALSRAYARLGRVELANEHARRAEELHAEAEAKALENRLVTAYPRNLHSRLLLTKRAIDKGNLAEATALLDEAIREHPDNAYLQQLRQALRENEAP